MILFKIKPPHPATEKILREMGFPERKTDKTLSGRTISLVHKNDFASIPDGTELISIVGERVIKGVDYIDDDTREGYYAYGTLVEET